VGNAEGVFQAGAARVFSTAHLRRKLYWCPIVQTAVRPFFVIVPAPACDLPLGVEQVVASQSPPTLVLPAGWRSWYPLLVRRCVLAQRRTHRIQCLRFFRRRHNPLPDRSGRRAWIDRLSRSSQQHMQATVPLLGLLPRQLHYLPSQSFIPSFGLIAIAADGHRQQPADPALADPVLSRSQRPSVLRSTSSIRFLRSLLSASPGPDLDPPPASSAGRSHPPVV
jgi:hypothetical protein